ncbi:MAG: Glu/Leu/Phe/Val dehydrogenase, C terminal [Caldanaerobacter subterraneus]|jgi:leucine dehydrogenase|uniref:Glu/Leu/Phe/Val family dehydrogenase n=1 Tax=unclassified Thermoanaerobacter TaxID=2636821 RepID=UPI0000E1E127|nr:Glu/Leu/Phe/Val dehydrogenase [Thermoanaerobacter sp. X514]KUJ91753.1 MAG: Glu/Leu/Phe/Val dehydrogenase [Thermoanaerobacter thermocopriae]KUK35312.1 MAG: Glu/Leu/Phe/Val dehydrogenase, C terminal [Caldanaerobacter subterraneus]HAA64002.1 Glu/Leu/Phe/Val dehydrogenase [Thermoanaerobacter sp.]ABY92239.1 Glu/Leu/Phe/Val dehydrogenase, C terminal [Thermoanaerobacter sp. X514]HAA81110.1 Glu/Leu/Phe/Val dehydrogenase [Thermoanaerobacter sp.]
MKIFDIMETKDYENVILCHDKTSGLKAIIAIHDTTLGPALGGCRMWTYDSEEDAINDALRLARGMTYKNAAAGLNLGGGKTVVIGNPRKDKSEALFRSLGRYIESLKGRYITAEDVGTNLKDMEYIRYETKYVAGLAETSGDPSPFTAYGVFRGIQAASEEVFGTSDLKGMRIAIQGVGNVGYNLAKHLYEAGAKLIVTDIFEDNVKRAVEEFKAEYVKPDEIYGVECDIFAPCALGAIINDETIPQLKCKIVAGSANNQLKEERHGDILQEKGILYVPDYIINAGGVINVADELNPSGYNRDRAMRKVSMIFDTVKKVIQKSKEENIPTYVAADRVAEERIKTIAAVKDNYIVK